jgi:MYXO-CTERM domain-containing protein
MGSIDAYNLVEAWKGLYPTATQLMAVSGGTVEGSPLTLTVTVTSDNTGSTKMTGPVDFYYTTNLPDDGGVDIAYFLPDGEGQTLLDTTSGGDQAGTITFDTTAPPGFTGTSQIVAFFEGDNNYLASWSQPVTVMAKPTLVISPTTATVAPLGTIQFTASGADAGISTSWNFFADNSGANIDIYSGLYTAGDAGGTTDIVVALDSYGAQALATINVVTPTPEGGTVMDSGSPMNDSSTPMTDGGKPAADSSSPTMEASTEDGAIEEGGTDGGKSGGGGSSGCGCREAGAGGATSAAGASLALLGVLFFGVRRRRR